MSRNAGAVGEVKNRILISILKKSTVKKNNSYFSADNLASEFFINPIPNQLGHVTYNERADSALTW